MKYKVPFVDVPAHFQTIEDEVMAAVRSVIRKGNLILRDELREFEDQFARLVGTRYAVGVNSGTDALHLTLRALGITQGDEVVTVSHTCVATIAAIVHSGATPVLVDVADDFNMDMAKLDEVITSRVRAIVPVHLNGRACDMARLQSIARKHGLLIVEDCAQALGARFSAQMVGSFGRAGCFSLYPFKMLGAFGDGGMIVTNDPVLAKTVSRLRDYGEDRETGEVLHFGFNSRLDNLHAAVLTVKLKHFPAWVERRRAISRLYLAGLSDLPQIVLPHFPGEAWSDVYMNYAVRAERRDALAEYLKACGIEPLMPISLVTPVHRHKALKLEHFSLPMTDRIAREFLYLPISPELDDEQIDYAVHCVRKFYQNPA